MSSYQRITNYNQSPFSPVWLPEGNRIVTSGPITIPTSYKAYVNMDIGCNCGYHQVTMIKHNLDGGFNPSEKY